MEGNDGKRGFSGLSDLASNTEELIKPLSAPNVPQNISVPENVGVQESTENPSAPPANQKYFLLAVFIAVMIGAIYMFASPSSAQRPTQQQIVNSATNQNPPAPSIPPVKKNTATQIISEISSALSSSKPINQNQVNIKGKLLVWDQNKNKLSDVQNSLADNLQWKENYDGKTTVMIINSFSDEKVGSYGSDIPAYRRTANISIVSWPDKASIGRVSIVGDDPPQSIRYKSRPQAIYGEINQSIAKWIERCQKTP